MINTSAYIHIDILIRIRIPIFIKDIFGRWSCMIIFVFCFHSPFRYISFAVLIANKRQFCVHIIQPTADILQILSATYRIKRIKKLDKILAKLFLGRQQVSKMACSNKKYITYHFDVIQFNFNYCLEDAKLQTHFYYQASFYIIFIQTSCRSVVLEYNSF